jgi:MFS transporter, DHA1 family, inner membrane transport protein
MSQQGFANKSFGVVLLSRLALNMQMRVIYPFLPAISRALGVPLQTTSLLLTARAVANLSSPLYGALSDRFGRRALMIAGMLILIAGTAGVFLAPTFTFVLGAVAFLSLSKAVYDPAVLAYLGDTIPYERRGRMMGILALMWPSSWAIGVPVAGYLITSFGWRSPFIFIGLLGVAGLALTWFFPAVGRSAQPAKAAQVNSGQGSQGPKSVWAGFSFSSIPRPAWMALIVTMLILLASENVYIVYGAWLEKQFGLSVAAIGVASLVICLAEFSAESVSTGWVDRIGKRRAVMYGLLLNAAAFVLLPQIAVNLTGALVGLFLVYLTYDFSVVSTLPLITELAPGARGTMMALNVAAMAVGRLISSLVAVRLWNAGGLIANTLVSSALVVVAWLILASAIRERKSQVAVLPS